ncbi:hypothetical protein MMC13_000608 [Lambiella insularis]|nr:hypothetical protein [Lambiella insularis]
MQNYLLALLCAAAAYLVYVVVDRFLTNRRHAAEAARLGCKPCAAVLPCKLPFGIDRIAEALRADKAMQFPPMIMARSESMADRTYVVHILGKTIHMTADPKNIQAVLATQFQDFDLGVVRHDNFFPLLGNGIFTTDGKVWEHSRAMMRPQFARDQVSDLELEEGHVRNLMRALPSVGTDGWTPEVDLQVFFFRLTLDSAAEFLLGESVGSQLACLPENVSLPSTNRVGHVRGVEFGAAFDRSQSWIATRMRMAEKHYLVNTADFRKCNKICHEFIDYYVNLALNRELKEKELEKGTLGAKKDRYIFLEALVAETRDPIQLRDECLNILLAGRDTTASLLGWLFYLLVRHPEVYNKLRSTVVESFGTYNNSAELSFVSLKNCTFLQHCLNESLRLFPVVPLNSRRAVRDTTIPRGGGPDGMSKIYVRKGEQVDYSVHVMHHRKALWGEDAEEFKPERWVGRKPGWEYLPFNGGPRICLGQQFALTEASYVAVRLLQRFDAMQNCDPEPVPRHSLSLTSCSGNGVKVRLHEAKE